MVLCGRLHGRVGGYRFLTGCGSVWLERLIWDQEVAGSNPVTPIPYVPVAQQDRAVAF